MLEEFVLVPCLLTTLAVATASTVVLCSKKDPQQEKYKHRWKDINAGQNSGIALQHSEIADQDPEEIRVEHDTEIQIPDEITKTWDVSAKGDLSQLSKEQIKSMEMAKSKEKAKSRSSLPRKPTSAGKSKSRSKSEDNKKDKDKAAAAGGGKKSGAKPPKDKKKKKKTHEEDE